MLRRGTAPDMEIRPFRAKLADAVRRASAA
jgi:hypothetical protein